MYIDKIYIMTCEPNKFPKFVIKLYVKKKKKM